MRREVDALIDKFVDEILTNSHFLHNQKPKPRLVAISRFVNKLILILDTLEDYDEPGVKKILSKLHQENYNAIYREKLKSDREYLLRIFESELLDKDNVFKREYQKANGENVDYTMDIQLEDLLWTFKDFCTPLEQGDRWCIGKKEYRIVGEFAFSDLWLLDDDEQLVRLRELLPLSLKDFRKL